MSYEGLPSEIVIAIVVGMMGFVLSYFRSKLKKTGELEDEVTILKRENKNLKKAILLITKRMDKSLKQFHPNNDVDLDFEELMKSLLTDEILGNKSPKRKSAI